MADISKMNPDGTTYDLKDAVAREKLTVVDPTAGSGLITFGVDSEGNYGYKKVGADTVTPFRTGSGDPNHGDITLSQFNGMSDASLLALNEGDNEYGTQINENESGHRQIIEGNNVYDFTFTLNHENVCKIVKTTSSLIQLNVGSEYRFGTYNDYNANGRVDGFKLRCCEKLDNYNYAMLIIGNESAGVDAKGVWPNKNAGSDIIYQDISNLIYLNDNPSAIDIYNFYDKYKSIESNGGIDASTFTYNDTNTKNGIYLLPSSNISSVISGGGHSTSNPDTSNKFYQYWLALKFACTYLNQNYSGYRATWLGTHIGTTSATYENKDGSVNSSNWQNVRLIAPAINIDVRKINLNGNTITIK